MPYLKIGDWSFHADGLRGTLRIQEIDELGRVAGTLFDEPINGWWSERARRLAFIHEQSRVGAVADQGFQGYAWDEPLDPGGSRAGWMRLTETGRQDSPS